MKSTYNSIFIKNKKTPTEISYIYVSPQGNTLEVDLNFRNFTYCIPSIFSTPKPWPNLEGDTGLSTLFYAIQLET